MNEQSDGEKQNNVIPFRPRQGPEQMVRAVEEALRRMWVRAAEEPVPDNIVRLLDQLERRQAEWK